MGNNLVLEKWEENISDNVDLDREKVDLFSYKKDDTLIGYAFVKKDNINIDNIYIKIFDKYQSNGYGKSLFNELIKVLKERKFKEIILNIDKDNYKMINILKNNGGLELSTVNGIKKIIIKL